VGHEAAHRADGRGSGLSGRTSSPPPLASLRVRLVGTVLVAIAPALILLAVTDLPWVGFVIGLSALAAAWFGGENFVLRQVKVLSVSISRLSQGDLSTRTGLERERGELGELARSFDNMAATLEQQTRKRQIAERIVLERAQQQAALAAMGQFALAGNNLPELLNQAVTFIAQTLGVDYCGVLELLPSGKALLLRAGIGWKDGCVGHASVDADQDSQIGHSFIFSEPLIVEDFSTKGRFRTPQLLRKHGVVSGVNVVIEGHELPYGVLGVYTASRRTFGEDEVHFLQAMGHVLAAALERIRTEAELNKLAAFAQFNPNPILEFSPDGNANYFNDAAAALMDKLGKVDLRGFLPDDAHQIVRTCLQTGQAKTNVEARAANRILSWSFFPVAASQVVHCYVEDITDRLSLEAQLRQAQKMESVGQLAAGVAHDFNNMLTVIQGYAGLLLARPTLAKDLIDPIRAISFAAERAANLTRKLLMFSRGNVMQARPLDLRTVVGDMTKMLRRLLGETVALEFHPPSSLPLVRADLGMIEQVIMNLSVNARDAMPKGGTLTIGIGTQEFDEAHAKANPDARPGMFVCLRMSDTGCGMDAATLAHIFEPFFTTKELGKGTGLGLATVFGIIKQHDGWIEVESQVGSGTTFSIFLPASAKPAPASSEEPALPATPSAESRGGHETILLVEDEPALRQLAKLILAGQGYHIFEASKGAEALEIWERHREQIDLVLTDVVMPEGMSGKDLADRLQAHCPDLKVVFTSGYTAEMNKDNVRFLQKPYSRETLTQAVRDCLDAPCPSRS
jgi:signal transduction histidine kinase/HAMP domain-containing protein